ncbi:hypothetical protein [Rhodopirellula sallentina]|uniref:Putative membrane protein n=1 Tax=Rhodopirellula sallentina SM41 TaxID=1263870 RepID=M5U2U8_9BACT|nr:hypothetical protein [Rhodopirellula sallentina]EMI55760.1 putative membrane protein [Rhodopirellula sallentina SM41]
MIVPSYWAESKRTIKHDNRQMTVRRFGWSDDSQSAAQEHAEQRVDDAVKKITSGESTLLAEPKVPYNGADGLPIREEIVSRHGESVMTRNAYGALCLNTPDVLIADVDAEERPGCGPYGYVFWGYSIVYIVLAWRVEGLRSLFLYLLGAFVVVTLLGSAWHWLRDRMRGSLKQAARDRIERFSNSHSDWGMRLYETPRGWRVLVSHSTFDPRGDAVRDFFQAIGADPIYVRMCFNQNCFRARVSPKPWRIGIDDHLKPRPGVWPITPERMPQRKRWVEEYERLSTQYAACRFVESLGSVSQCEEARRVIQVHDRMSGANTQFKIA